MKLCMIPAFEAFPHRYRANNLRRVRLNLRNKALILLTASREGALFMGPAKSYMPYINGCTSFRRLWQPST